MVAHYAILNVILYAFLRVKWGKTSTYHHSVRKTHTKWRLLL